MDYYIRAFCIADQVPTLREVVQWLESRELKLVVEGAAGLDDPHWQEASFFYQRDRKPIIVQCARATGPDSPARKQADDFIARIGPPGKSYAKKRVVNHLKETRFVIANKLPVDDMTDAGWDANGQILTYFRDNCRAMIQADREGFYEGTALVLKME